jgi:cellulose synthase/poly-beta-1,6-N-acetylglucosamine synthase-like glycosyltransferase
MTIVLAAILLYSVFLAASAWWRPRPRKADHPNGLSFWIVLLGADDKAIKAASALDEPEYPVRVLCQDTTQSKGEALNAAYRHIRDSAVEQGVVRQTVIGVIHGDGCAAPGTLKEIAAFFSGRRVGAVQSRLRMSKSLSDLDYTATEDASQRRRDAFGLVKLGGNGQFIRLTALMRLGENPWSGSLGLRLHLAGVGIRYAPKAVVTQEAPSRVDLRSLKYLSQLTWPRAAVLIAPWLAAPLAAGVLALTIVTGNAGWLAVLLAPGIVQRLRPSGEPWRRALAAGFLYPVFLLLRMVAPWRALIRVTNVVPMVPPRLLPWADGHPGLSARRP